MTVAKPDYKDVILFQNGDTDDIISVLLDTVKDTADQTKGFARQFSKDREGMKAIYDFIMANIKYKADPDGKQWIKTPARFYADKVGDCKSYTVFIVSVLHNMGLKYKIRFASYDRDKIVTHVYPIAILPNGKEVIIDAVWGDAGGSFNSEKKFNFKIDYDMTQIHRLSGIRNYQSQAEVGNIFDNIGKWFRNKGINKVAILCLHAFYPKDRAVKVGSPTYIKIQKSKKLMNFLITQSPLNRLDSEAEIRKGIKEKTGKSPEELFIQMLPPPPAEIPLPTYNETNFETTGRRGAKIGEPITAVTVTLILGLVSIAWTIIKDIIARKADIDFQKNDAIPDPDQMAQDTLYLTQAEQAAANDNGGFTGGNTDNNGEKDNTMMYILLGLGAYVALSD